MKPGDKVRVIQPGYDHVDLWPLAGKLVCRTCGAEGHIWSPDVDSAEERHGSASAS